MKIILDLLPQEKKDELKQKKVFSMLLSQGIRFTFPLILALLVIFSAYYILKIQETESSTAFNLEQSVGQFRELNKYENEFKNMNRKIEVIGRIQDGHLNWSKVLENLNKATPEEVTLSNIASKDLKLLVAGKANNRDDLLKFKDSLESVGCFRDINVPLSNLVTKENLSFQIDFFIKDDCIK